MKFAAINPSGAYNIYHVFFARAISYKKGVVRRVWGRDLAVARLARPVGVWHAVCNKNPRLTRRLVSLHDVVQFYRTSRKRFINYSKPMHTFHIKNVRDKKKKKGVHPTPNPNPFT